MNKKIICKIKGGFANQCIQFIFSNSIAKKTNRELFLDLSDYKMGGIFQTLKKNTKQDVFDFFYTQPSCNFLFFLEVFQSFDFVFADGKSVSDMINCESDCIYLNGYWHQHEYVDEFDFSVVSHLKGVVLKRLSSSSNHWLEKIKSSSNSVSIHVRRGDYLVGKHKDVYGVCPLDYFIRSFDLIREEIKSTPEVFIFTDDPKWIDDKFSSIGTYHLVSGHTSLIDDFILMMSCKHNIISNSSFSWLSATLNTQKTSIKVAPRTWFKSSKMLGLSTKNFYTIDTELE